MELRRTHGLAFRQAFGWRQERGENREGQASDAVAMARRAIREHECALNGSDAGDVSATDTEFGGGSPSGRRILKINYLLARAANEVYDAAILQLRQCQKGYTVRPTSPTHRNHGDTSVGSRFTVGLRKDLFMRASSRVLTGQSLPHPPAAPSDVEEAQQKSSNY